MTESNEAEDGLGLQVCQERRRPNLNEVKRNPSLEIQPETGSGIENTLDILMSGAQNSFECFESAVGELTEFASPAEQFEINLRILRLESERSASNKELLRALEQGTKDLPHRQRRLVWLMLAGRSVSAMQEELGIKRSQVYVTRDAAIQQLRRSLGAFVD